MVAPQAAKVEYEDAHVRVVRLKLAPGEKLPMHDRPNRVVIPLTDNDVTTTGADGKSHEVKAPAGVAAWSGPGKRSVENHATPLENIVVELKNATEPAKPLQGPPTPRPPEWLEEKYHRWQFEKQYVRVYDVRIPPGVTCDFHLHALDAVAVEISGGFEGQQPKGGEWMKPNNDPPGTVFALHDRGKPRIHRVRNEDATREFHVVLVQLK